MISGHFELLESVIGKDGNFSTRTLVPRAPCQPAGLKKKSERQIRWAHSNQSGCVWITKHWAASFASPV